MRRWYRTTAWSRNPEDLDLNCSNKLEHVHYTAALLNAIYLRCDLSLGTF